MSRQKTLDLLATGKTPWNRWRRENAEVQAFEPDLHGADLHGMDLHEADLTEANLQDADLREADLPTTCAMSSPKCSSLFSGSSVSSTGMGSRLARREMEG
jgi:uncharacterized protein YjbI with pentapeptide repeats